VEYVRHGAVSLFAALEVHSGKVLGRCAPRHTSEQFVEFLNQTVAGQPRKTIRVMLDNLAVHKSPLAGLPGTTPPCSLSLYAHLLLLAEPGGSGWV
jgi:hypothetical protein